MDKKRMNCYLGLNFIESKSKMKWFKTSSKLGQLHLQVLKNQNSLEAST